MFHLLEGSQNEGRFDQITCHGGTGGRDKLYSFFNLDTTIGVGG